MTKANQEVLDELKALREEVAGLRLELRMQAGSVAVHVPLFTQSSPFYVPLRWQRYFTPVTSDAAGEPRA